MAKEGKKYEENFNQLKAIAEELSHQEISIDEVISKGKKAAEAAKNCINILKTEKGSFKKLEDELLSISEEVDEILEEEDDDKEEDEE
ncbi:MAG: exodeoxyribonuclease VII small subunit [Proteobacteria bacterium]|nr:exodeoxyribonuclease VII small subunit [Pseudomonadota bacterium]